MDPKKFDYIDALRGVAILLVLLVHCGHYGFKVEYFPELLKQFVSNGQFGVQVFLLVSAYTLMHSQKSRGDEMNKTKRFYLRRFFRVAPMYYFGVLYFTLQNTVGLNQIFNLKAWGNLDFVGIFSNLFFVHGFHPHTINYYVPGGWSIAVEMTFYLFFPLLVKYIINFNKAVVFIILTIVLQKILAISLSDISFFNENYYLSLWFPNQLPIFALGILVYFAVNESGVRLTEINTLMIAFVSFVFIYISIPISFSYAFVFGILIVYFHKYGMNKYINFALTKVGKISYSMYLVHFAVLFLFEKYRMVDYLVVTDIKSAVLNFVVRYFLLFIISAIISYISYQLIELPFQNMGNKLIRKYV